MPWWEELRAEMLRQEILELEAQPNPKDRLAYLEHRQRIVSLRRKLDSIWARDCKLAAEALHDSMKKYLNKPEDVAEEELMKATDDLHKNIERQADYIEKRGEHLRAGLWQRWQHASLSQRGKIAATYSMHRIALGTRRGTLKSLRFCLNMMHRSMRW